ncbi:tetratricopeptide repeat protein [Allosphingosinicella sp.]|uniref:tetratricopeptide repeat protein n=1 Tax=Allosphingosinicella sp. TaxID=2823234 RepID=UPI002F026CB5
MIGKILLALAASLALASPADAHTITVMRSNSDAADCFRAAEDDGARRESLQLCDRALADVTLASHDRMATFVNRGILRSRTGDFDGAFADFDSALAIEPNHPDAMINRGITMLAAGRPIDESKAVIEQGLAREPARPWVGYYGRAVANEMAGRDSAAYHDYRRALALRPGWRLASEALARFSVRP